MERDLKETPAQEAESTQKQHCVGAKPLFTVGDHVSARSARSRRRLEKYQRAPYETHILE